MKTYGIITRAAMWLADFPLSEEPTNDELLAQFPGLDGQQVLEARRASVEFRQRNAFYANRPRHVPGLGRATGE